MIYRASLNKHINSLLVALIFRSYITKKIQEYKKRIYRSNTYINETKKLILFVRINYMGFDILMALINLWKYLFAEQHLRYRKLGRPIPEIDTYLNKFLQPSKP